MIASAGLAVCFVVNGISYAACIVGLALMHTAVLVPV